MRYLLDTDTCVDIIRQKLPAVLTRLRREPVGTVCISTITLSELDYGVEKSSDPDRNRIALTEFLTPLQVLPYDDRAATRYGAIRAGLEARGVPISSLDLLIAAHALSLGLTVVTGNGREFARVPGLQVENWRR
ncbi:MAG: hypothetical protein A3K19_32795 [Lentisphaerae bacterium RIFOXYB12_FULL_65_16]|nr:MAG: hypothetical protein A3K18_20295 [Lentisphaerae bacterium RIFOXYA12_64_32]OGV84522.1 MAG: hypothetical protein A3K19_32795 [Lentisphaerae bacterium RIFOXYB12_FULL_65_16]